MRRLILLILIITATVFLLACGRRVSQPETADAPDPGTSHILLHEHTERSVPVRRVRALAEVRSVSRPGGQRSVRIWRIPAPEPQTDGGLHDYLQRLGVSSVYDLSPGAHLLRIRPVPDPVLPGTTTSAIRLRVPHGWSSVIREAAQRHGLDPGLVAAVIRAESDFDRLAVSPAGAQGAMQIMPETQRELGLTDAFDLRANILAGTAHLGRLLRRYRNTRLALAAYNAGEGAVDRAHGIPDYTETKDFVSRVLRFWQGQEGMLGTAETTQHIRRRTGSADRRPRQRHRTGRQSGYGRTGSGRRPS